MKEKIENIENQLLSKIESQMSCLNNVDTEELAKAIDAVHHLEEAMYYCSIIEAMEKSSEEKEKMNINYYMEPTRYYQGQPRNADGSFASDGRRNYSEGQGDMGGQNGNGGTHYYVPYMEYAPYMMRDEGWRDRHMYDGRSGISRRMYMEGKQTHMGDDQQSMKELEHYIKDLGEDLTDMIKESTAEEKQVLSAKLQQLANKISR